MIENMIMKDTVKSKVKEIASSGCFKYLDPYFKVVGTFNKMWLRELSMGIENEERKVEYYVIEMCP